MEYKKQRVKIKVFKDNINKLLIENWKQISKNGREGIKLFYKYY